MGTQYSDRGISLLRIVVGFWFLKAGLSHLSWTPLPWVSERWAKIMPKVVGGHAKDNPIPLVKGFLEEIVLPNSNIFAGMSSLGELCVGLSLTFGIATVLGGVGGFFLAASYGLMTIYKPSSQGFHLILVTAMLVFVVTRAGRTWGVDSILHRIKPGAWIW